MGFGTVGTGVEEILYKKREALLKNNFDIKIEKVLTWMRSFHSQMILMKF